MLVPNVLIKELMKQENILTTVANITMINTFSANKIKRNPHKEKGRWKHTILYVHSISCT